MPKSPRELPFLVGRYRCEEYLGGGMADVFKARDTELPRDVAIKILKEESFEDQEARRAFLDEVSLACQCQHENVVTTYDKGDFQGAPYIVMEFLRGESLQAMIKRGALANQRETLRIALEVARALECVHGLGIIHRDLKPANIHINQQGKAKLVDFGIAKVAEWNRTQAGFTKGTPHYMAPEQVLGRDVSYTADVWAFGVVLFEMLSGHRPFVRDRLDQLWAAILNAEPDWPALDGRGVTQGLALLLRRCLEKDPAKRYPNFTVIGKEIERLLAAPAQSELLAETALTPSGTVTMAVPAVTAAGEEVTMAAEAVTMPESPVLAGSEDVTMAAPVSPMVRPPVVAPPPEVPAVVQPVVAEPEVVAAPVAPSGGLPKIAIAAVAAVVVLGAVVGGLMMRGKSPAAQEKKAAPSELAKRLSFPTSGDMLLVPKGPALIGSNQRPIDVPDFYLDETEVSNASYANFLKATGRAAPKGFAQGSPELPVVNVTVADAEAFAAWAGKRLPSEVEWEKAARGSEGRKFPWGEDPNAAYANVSDNPELKSGHGVMPVRSFMNVASPYGVVNLVGNVWEWVDAQHAPAQDVLNMLRTVPGLSKPPAAGDVFYAIRGGSYQNLLKDISVADFAPFPAVEGYENIGFRCARDAGR